MRLVLSILLFFICSFAAWQDITNPNVRSGCTPRCTDVSSIGRYRCSSALRKSQPSEETVCNTFEIQQSVHTCHFHYFDQSESSQCLVNQNLDVIWMGASTMQGASSTVSLWHSNLADSATSDVFNVFEWLNGPNHVADVDLYGNMGIFETIHNSDGSLNSKIGIPDYWQYNMYERFADESTSKPSGTTRNTFFNSRSWVEAQLALDTLESSGRQSGDGILIVQINVWYQFCVDDPNLCFYRGGDDIEAIRSSTSAVASKFQEDLKSFLDRVETDFPKYRVFIMGSDAYSGLLTQFNTFIDEEVKARDIFQVNYETMVSPVNSEVQTKVNFHALQFVTMSLYQRILSFACAEPSKTVECEESVVFGTGANAYTPVTSNWWEIYQRYTTMSTFTSSNTYTPPANTSACYGFECIEGLALGQEENVPMLLGEPVPSQYKGQTAQDIRRITSLADPWDWNGWRIFWFILSVLIIGYTYFKAFNRYFPSEKNEQVKKSKIPTESIKNDQKTDTTESSGNSNQSGETETQDIDSEGPEIIVTTPISPRDQKKPLVWGYIDAFDGARVLASLHGVIRHMNDRGYRFTNDDNWETWGFTWVPWFLTLSGFLLTYLSFKGKAADEAAGRSRPEESAYIFGIKRLMRIYPIYLFALVLAYLIQVHEYSTMNPDMSWVQVIVMLTLTQAWLPKFTEDSLQAHCWFLSCILVYWFLHKYIQKYISHLSITYLWSLVISCTLVALIAFALPLEGHPWKAYEDGTDVLVVILKYHPFVYFHVYSFGVAAACLFRYYRENPPAVFRYGTSVGFIGLLILFVTVDADKDVNLSIWARIGGLLPLQGLILIGLAFSSDPLTWLLGTWVFKETGKYSYALYVLQFVAFSIWGGYTDLGYWMFLLAFSIVVSKVDEYYRQKDPKTFLRNVGFAFLFFWMFFFIASFIPQSDLDRAIDWAKGEPSYFTPQQYAYPNTNTVDTRLSLQADGLLDGTVSSNQYSIINPSIYKFNGEFYIAARRHFLEQVKGTLLDADFVTNLWHSDIVVSTVSFSGNAFALNAPLVKFDVSPSGTAGPWVPCVSPPVYIPENNTWIQKNVTGPEDPRLFQFDGSLYMSFFSTLPTGSTCPSTGTSGTMFLSSRIYSGGQLVAAPSGNSIYTDEESTIEKNWMVIEDSQVKMIRDLSTLEIMDITGLPGTDASASESNNAQFDDLQNKANSLGVQVHGGSNMISYTELDGSDKLLGVFHTVDSSNVYETYFFKTNPSDPYGPLAVSRKVPLMYSDKSCPVFASGLSMIDEEMIVVSYGTCDVESRVFVLSRTDLVSFFE